MSLDISTLYAIATLVAALLGTLLLHFAYQEKIAALNLWGAAYLLAAAAVALWTLLGTAPGNVVSGIVGASGIFASGMIWNAARVFHGRRQTWVAVLAGIVAWIAVFALPFDSPSLRLTVGVAIIALFAGLASGELWSERRRAMHRRWPALLVPILHGSVLLLPVLIGDFVAGGAPLAQTHWATLFVVELVLYAIGTVFVIVMLVSERSIRAHKQAASTDPLTGLFNRRGFAEAAGMVMARQAKLGKPVSILVFDLDHFKSINDRFGHAAGDDVLKLFASTLAQTLRTYDLCGRLGGEEFAALLACAPEDATIAAERVRKAFASSDIAIDDVKIDTTISVGVAGGVTTDLEGALLIADAALYRAKKEGRNRTIMAAGSDSHSVERLEAPRKPNVVRRASAADPIRERAA